MNIRVPTRADLPAISLVLRDTELFPVEMLDDLISPFLSGSSTDDRWLVCETDNRNVVGFSYCRREPLTEGTWNLLAIGLRKQQQGRGLGKALLHGVEQLLANERLLIVDTSGLETFSATRAFYEKCGYEREAVIRDYWADGDDKVTYRKPLR